MKDKEIHHLHLDCKNRLAQQDYKYPNQDKLEEIKEILAQEKVYWIDGEVGELLANIITNVRCEYTFSHSLGEAYFNQLFANIQTPIRTAIAYKPTILVLHKQDIGAFNLHNKDFNKILLINPLFSKSEIDRRMWDIEENEYSLLLKLKSRTINKTLAPAIKIEKHDISDKEHRDSTQELG